MGKVARTRRMGRLPTGSASGAPAVTLARSLTQSFAGIRPADVTGFVFAQLVGALAALPVTSMLISNQAPIDEKP